MPDRPLARLVLICSLWLLCSAPAAPSAALPGTLCTLQPGAVEPAGRHPARARAPPAPVPRSEARHAGATASGRATRSRSSAPRRARWRRRRGGRRERVRYRISPGERQGTWPSAICTPSIAGTAPTPRPRPGAARVVDLRDRARAAGLGCRRDVQRCRAACRRRRPPARSRAGTPTSSAAGRQARPGAALVRDLPCGSELKQGSEMLHVWFTSDLRSAFAVHAPVPELCRDGLLSAKACAERREMRPRRG